MEIKRIKRFIFITLLSIIIIPTKAHALSGSMQVSCSNTTLSINSTTTCNIYANVNDVIKGYSGSVSTTGDLSITSIAKGSWEGASSGTKFDLYTSDNKSGQVLIGTVTVKLTGSNGGTVNVSSSTVTDSSYNDVTLSGASTRINYYSQSTNTNLASLSVSNCNLTPSFNANTTSYSCGEIADGSVSISASPEDSKSTVSGTGKKYLNYGSNTLTVSVKSESGSKKDYKIYITRTDSRSGDATLSNLSVDGYNINFNKDTYNYELTIPYDVLTISINGTSTDSNTIINGLGTFAPDVGTNVYKITTTAQNGTKLEYTITVTKTEKPNVPSTDLSYLKVEDQEISITSNKYYKLSYFGTKTSLDITASTSSKTSNIEILDNNNLTSGINKITIKINDDGCTENIIYLYVFISTYDKLQSNEIKNSSYINFNKQNTYTINKDILNNLEDNKLQVNILDNDNGLYASLLFEGSKDLEEDYELYFLKANDDPYILFTNAIIDTEITYYIGDIFTSDKLYVYGKSLDDSINLIKVVDVNNKYITFESNGSLEYYIYDKTIEEVTKEKYTCENKTKSNNILIYILIIIILIIFLLSILIYKNKSKIINFITKKNKPKEESITPIPISTISNTQPVINNTISNNQVLSNTQSNLNNQILNNNIINNNGVTTNDQNIQNQQKIN